MRKTILVSLALLGHGAWLHGAYAADTKVLNFVTLDFPPLEFNDKDGKATGAAVDIVKEISEQLGYKAQVSVLPWTRGLDQAKDGKVDGIFTTYRVPGRETFLEYSNEVLIPQIVSLYVKKGSSLSFNGDVRELIGKTIATVSTISYGTAFDEARKKLDLRTERVDTLELNFRKLLSGRIDYVISNRFTAQYEIERLNLSDDIVELQVPVEVTPSYIGFSKKSRFRFLREHFDQALKDMRKSGRYYEILQRYKVRVPR